MFAELNGFLTKKDNAERLEEWRHAKEDGGGSETREAAGRPPWENTWRWKNWPSSAGEGPLPKHFPDGCLLKKQTVS